MVPTTKEALRKLVTDTTIEIYEDLTPQLIQMIDQTKTKFQNVAQSL